MYKNYFGKERQGLLNWLTGEWLPKGPTTCFMVGFPGVGKSDVAAAVSEHAERQLSFPTLYIEVPCHENPSFGDLMLDLADQLAAIGQTAMRTALSQPESNPAYAIERALRDDILIVVDEFGRFFERNGKLCPDAAGVYLWQSSLGDRGEIFDRIVPIVLSDACIDQPIDRLKIVRYWKEERERLQEATEGLDPLSLGDSIREELLFIQDIERRSSDLLRWVSDVLMPRGTAVVGERFDDFIELIEQRHTLH